MTEEFQPHPRSGVERLLGDRPVGLAIRLGLLSLFVGFVMTVMGLDVADLVRGAFEAVQNALQDGSGVLRRMGTYIATGATVVVPLWLIMRLLRRR